MIPAPLIAASPLFRWPSPSEVLHVLTLADYNTRIVVVGVSLLGLAAGVVGSFVLLRKRALLGDVISHATLPGIAGAFLLAVWSGASGKSLPLLLAGAATTGTLGVLTVLLITRFTRLKEDAALGIVLSVFFGAGVALSVLATKLNVGHAAGLDSFIYGKTAAMVAADARLILFGALAVMAVCLLLFKELRLLCFDPGFAAAQGWPVAMLDVVLMVLVVGVTVIGLQAVGLILVIALLVTPPVAARFWSDRLPRMVMLAGVFGALSGMLGAMGSALLPRMPAGAVIVIMAGSVFIVSLLLGGARGALPRWIGHYRLSRTVARQHLLRSLYELAELRGANGPAAATESPPIPRSALRAKRHWTAKGLSRALRDAERSGFVVRADSTGSGWRLTELGRLAAWRVTRNHRLWELFLITHAEIAPSHVDRDADQVEHVLDPEMIATLETLLARDTPHLSIPPSPHDVALLPAGAGGAP